MNLRDPRGVQSACTCNYANSNSAAGVIACNASATANDGEHPYAIRKRGRVFHPAFFR